MDANEYVYDWAKRKGYLKDFWSSGNPMLGWKEAADIAEGFAKEATDDAHRKMLSRLGGEEWTTAVPTSEWYLSGKKAEDAVYNQATFLAERAKTEIIYNIKTLLEHSTFWNQVREYWDKLKIWKETGATHAEGSLVERDYDRMAKLMELFEATDECATQKT